MKHTHHAQLYRPCLLFSLEAFGLTQFRKKQNTHFTPFFSTIYITIMSKRFFSVVQNLKDCADPYSGASHLFSCVVARHYLSVTSTRLNQFSKCKSIVLDHRDATVVEERLDATLLCKCRSAQKLLANTCTIQSLVLFQTAPTDFTDEQVREMLPLYHNCPSPHQRRVFL